VCAAFYSAVFVKSICIFNRLMFMSRTTLMPHSHCRHS